METASVRPSAVTASAMPARRISVSKEKSGIDSCGRAPGRAPTVAMPVCAAPK
ncbi:MAG: hypothetical protein M5R42_07750 [Rhodocyclaceae bacterium]|nr:hypothetical protein [Rhodocyclaceae bacterium]